MGPCWDKQVNRVRHIIPQIGEFAAFFGSSLVAVGQSLFRPATWLNQFYAVFMGSLTLGIVAGVALGAVVWMHTYTVLARSGMVEYLPTALAAAVLLELAPIGAGLIVAARTGASLGAEIGAMKLGEQIDALYLFGQSPTRVLVGPRVLACMLTLPLLHVLIAAVALFSGFIAEGLIGQPNWSRYQEACMRELVFSEVVAAGVKTIVFGLLIGVSGCWMGLNARGGTEGIGQAATKSVVLACLFVLASDVLMVGVIRVLVV